MKANFWFSGTTLALTACLGLAACSEPPKPTEQATPAATAAAAAPATALADTLMNPKLTLNKLRLAL